MDNKKMENERREVLFIKHLLSGKQRNGKQKWKTKNNITYLQVKW